MSFLLKYFSIPLLASMLLQVKTCAVQPKAVLEPAAYIGWVDDPDNGLVVSKVLNDLVFTVQYKPVPYVIMQDEQRVLSQSQMKLALDSFSGMQYFTFRIGTTSGTDACRYHVSDDQEYYARQEYFAMKMQNDLFLIDGKDTLPCRMFHYERTYGIDPRANFVLAFENSKKGAGPKTILFDDKVLGAGPVMLSVAPEDLQHIPELKLSE